MCCGLLCEIPTSHPLLGLQVHVHWPCALPFPAAPEQLAFLLFTIGIDWGTSLGIIDAFDKEFPWGKSTVQKSSGCYISHFFGKMGILEIKKTGQSYYKVKEFQETEVLGDICNALREWAPQRSNVSGRPREASGPLPHSHRHVLSWVEVGSWRYPRFCD